MAACYLLCCLTGTLQTPNSASDMASHTHTHNTKVTQQVATQKELFELRILPGHGNTARPMELLPSPCKYCPAHGNSAEPMGYCPAHTQPCHLLLLQLALPSRLFCALLACRCCTLATAWCTSCSLNYPPLITGGLTSSGAPQRIEPVMTWACCPAYWASLAQSICVCAGL